VEVRDGQHVLPDADTTARVCAEWNSRLRLELR